MEKITSLTGRTYRHFMHDSLRRNSSLLIFSQAINAGAGFMFWVICAHLFATRDVGLATAFISFGVLVATFTNLGLLNTIIRFLPTSINKGGLFSASLILVTLCSITGAALATTLIKHLAPRLGFVQDSTPFVILLVLLVAGNAINGLMDGTLMAFRKGEYILGKALVTNLPRVILPFFVVSLALRGIVSAYVIMLLVGISYNVLIVLRRLLKGQSFKPSLQELAGHKTFALGNYLGGMVGVLPSTLIPIIVLNKLGAEQAAFIYMPMQLAAFLNIISSSTSQALISESSQNNKSEEHKAHFANASKQLYTILIPAILLVCLVGWPILRVYGSAYAAKGYVPLLLLASSSIFVAINWLGDTLLNIQKRSAAYFFMNAFNSIAVVGLAFTFAKYGLTAVTLGWLVGQVISALVYLIIFARAQVLSFTSGLRISS